MIALEKVVWAEGICLSQQHFQCWDRYYQQQIIMRCQWLQHHGWGLKSLKLDEELLSSGIIKLLSCEAIMPNGELLVFNEQYTSLAVKSLSLVKQKSARVYLALPVTSSISNIPGYPDINLPNAWQARLNSVHDQYDPQRQQEIVLATQAPKLLTDDNNLDQYIHIQILEILTTDGSTYQLSSKYIPSCIDLFSSVQLTQSLECITTKLKLHLEQLSQHSDKSNYLLALKQYYLALQMIQQQRICHPYEFYQVLMQMYNILCLLNDKKSQFYSYQHHKLSESFTSLLADTLQLINTPLNKSWKSWPLEKLDNLYQAHHISYDSKLLYVLEVNYGSKKSASATSFTQHSKISSQAMIKQIIQSAISGIELIPYEKQNIPFKVKPNHEYWKITPTQQQWVELLEQQSLAVYLPSHIDVAELTLLELGG